MFTLRACKHEILAKLDAPFWANLKLIVEFLEPFNIATNIIQSERASLLDVFMQFKSLEHHVQAVDGPLANGAAIMQGSISNHWEKHINKSAVFMVAKFSFEDTGSSLFSDRIKFEAPQWFESWCALLFQHSQSLLIDGRDSRTDEEKSKELRKSRQR